jgi:hypothetical protein
MSIIVDSIKDHLIPYISHLDSSKKMYDALTNLFLVRNIGQVMNLKNELCDMKMNDDDNIISYFVRISDVDACSLHNPQVRRSTSTQDLSFPMA